MPNIYTYVDYNGFLAEVAESDLNFVSGYWQSTAHYYRYDVVNYGYSLYVCTVANVGVSPPDETQFNSNWSIIAFTSTGTGSSGTGSSGGASLEMVDQVYSLAYRAYNIALTGTDLPTPGALDPWVLQWLGHTYNIARAGTNAANSADSWARDAFGIAVAGTNAANSAWGYAGQAWTIAVAGTNAAATAQAAANSADMWGRDAYSLAVDGTNAAESARQDAWAAWQYAGQAWEIATTGTQAADMAYSLALNALYTAWIGTNSGGGGGSGTVPTWVMDWLTQTYNLSVAGTTAANSADSWGRDAFSLAVDGTNAAADAQAAADSAYGLAYYALQTAWTGTGGGPGGGVPEWVMSWLGQTYNLAVTGTDAAAAAQTTADEALSLAQTLSTITEAGYQGTLIAFVGQVPGWKTDIEILVRNGIVTDVSNSRFSIELFNHYENGPVGTLPGDLHGGDRWDGTGRVLGYDSPYPVDYDRGWNEGLIGGAYEDFHQLTGTGGIDLTGLSTGSGWTDPWLINVQGYMVAGTESFESFDVGVVYGTQFVAATGYGWSGTVGFY